MDLSKLKEPIPYKYRVQSTKYGKSTIVSYIDSRSVQDRLDEVVGAENWQTDFKVIDGKLFAGIGINVSSLQGSQQWVWKWDVGTEANMEAEKSSVSDGVKRAAVVWGIGRFLYSLGIITLKAVEYKGKEYPATDNGEILWGADALTEYCKLVVASGELDRTKPNVKPIGNSKPATPKVQTPKVEAKPQTQQPDEAKTKALELFSKLDKANVLKHLITVEKLKYASVEDFIKAESIDKIREIYGKLTK